MLKWFKLIVAILLLPACGGTVMTFWRVLQATGSSDVTWVPMLAGVACWIVIFLMLPKPMWIYVLGHELTHAIWTWLFGGEVKKMKVSSKGGHVVVTKTNFLIGLAPYFFPFYVVVVILVFLVGNLIWDLNRHLEWFHLLVGAAYAFHVTLTVYVLRTRQSDITNEGYLFSLVIIVLGNALVLLVGLPLLTGKPHLAVVFRDWWNVTRDFYLEIWRMLLWR